MQARAGFSLAGLLNATDDDPNVEDAGEGGEERGAPSRLDVALMEDAHLLLKVPKRDFIGKAGDDGTPSARQIDNSVSSDEEGLRVYVGRHQLQKTSTEAVSAADNDSELGEETKESARPEYTCRSCHVTFWEKSLMVYHMYVSHRRAGSGRAVHLCTSCPKGFFRKSDLQKHRFCVHEKQRPHQCEVCPSAFFFLKDLRKHVLTVHEKQRPFECELCPSRFGKREHLTRHTRHVHEKLKRPVKGEKE